MFNRARSAHARLSLHWSRLVAGAVGAAASPALTGPTMLETMKRATTFMVEKVSTNGGYVWSYLPDLSRRWGEMEARPTMIWIQPPGTATMGHLFLDAYHATGDEYYYRGRGEGRRRADLGAAPVRRLELRGRLRRRRVAARLVRHRRQATAGGWRSSSTTGATPRSTMPARPKRRSSCCGSTSRSATRSTGRRSTRRSSSCSTASIRSARWPQRYPLQLRVRQARQARLHLLPHVQRRRRRREHRVPAACATRRWATARVLDADRARHERLPRDAAGRAAAGLGAAVHARPEAGRRAHLRAERRWSPTRPATNIAAAAAVPSPDRRYEVPRAHSRGARLARLGEALARDRGDRRRRPHAPHLHRNRHQQAALRPPHRVERRQRPILRRQGPAQDAGSLQRVPEGGHRRPARAVPRGDEDDVGGSDEGIAADRFAGRRGCRAMSRSGTPAPAAQPRRRSRRV